MKAYLEFFNALNLHIPEDDREDALEWISKDEFLKKCFFKWENLTFE